MHGHGILEFFWGLVWCVVSIYSSDRESPICRWRRPARPHSWCAGKEFKLYVSRGHHTLDIDNTSTWTKHCYNDYHSHNLSHVVVACSHTVITHRLFIKRAQLSVVVKSWCSHLKVCRGFKSFFLILSNWCWNLQNIQIQLI